MTVGENLTIIVCQMFFDRSSEKPMMALLLYPLGLTAMNPNYQNGFLAPSASLTVT
jgi:hypothetical protein